jgi:hypothetical protein
MIIRGTTIHRDGHGECGFLASPRHDSVIPFIASPFCFFRQGLRSTRISISVNHAWPCVAQRNTNLVSRRFWRLDTRLANERTRMGHARE